MATAKKPAAKKKSVKRPAAKKTAVDKTLEKSAVAKKPAAKKITAKKKVDYTKLLKLVESGKHQAEIMKVFAFKTAAQFKNHYLSALMKAGKAPEIITTRASAKATSTKDAFVSKRGSIVISKALVAELGFVEGDKFSVRKTKSGISLRKV